MAGLTLDGIAGKQLGARWASPRVVYWRQMTSALDAVHELATQGAPSGTVALCDEQTAGRGRAGRPWHSPAGGVWLAMLFRPPVAPAGPFALRAGLVTADVVDALLGAHRAQVKWPNDVMLGERKLAGILCETRWQGETLQWLALGIGLNVANPIPSEVAATAVALQEEKPGVQRLDVLDRLVPALWPLAAITGPLTERECVAFAERDWLRGRQLREPLFGRAAGIRPDGALLVETDVGATPVREGRVALA